MRILDFAKLEDKVLQALIQPNPLRISAPFGDESSLAAVRNFLHGGGAQPPGPAEQKGFFVYDAELGPRSILLRRAIRPDLRRPILMQNRLNLVVSAVCLLMLAARIGQDGADSLALVLGALLFPIGLLLTCALIRAAARLSAWHVTRRLKALLLL